MMKIDMVNAYDTIDWAFLVQVLRAFGFSVGVCNLVQQCVTTPWYSIVTNGMAKGFFKGGRGLRQGDPLLPYLFVIVEEIFSCLLRSRFEAGEVGYFSHPHGGPLISHLLYVDGMVIFSNGEKGSVGT